MILGKLFSFFLFFHRRNWDETSYIFKKIEDQYTEKPNSKKNYPFITRKKEEKITR